MIKPMSLSESELFDSDEYVYEPAWEGIRCIAFVKNDIRLQAEDLQDITRQFPEIEIRDEIRAENAIIDGVIIYLDKDGPNKTVLERRIKARGSEAKRLSKTHPTMYIAIDLLEVNGKDLMPRDLLKRKALMGEILREQGRIRTTPYLIGNGSRLLREVRSLGFNGVIAKRAKAPYRPGEKEWLRIHKRDSLDCIICGYKENYSNVGLALGLYWDDKLVPVGKAEAELRSELVDLLREMTITSCPFDGDSPIEDANWVIPVLVCEIEYGSVTRHGRLRGPMFVGLRLNKNPMECRFDQILRSRPCTLPFS